MNCKNTRSKLSRYADGELTAPESAEVGRHLEQCPDCRAQLDSIAVIEAAFETLEPAEPPPDFVTSVIAEAKRLRRDAGPRIVRFPRWHAMPAPARIAAAVAVLLGLVLGGATGHRAHQADAEAVSAYYETLSHNYLSEMPADNISNEYLALLSYGEQNNDF